MASTLKLVIQTEEGGLPSVTEGMAMIFQYLEEIHASGFNIDEVFMNTDGIYTIQHHRLNPISYNPATGEVRCTNREQCGPGTVNFLSCSTNDACYKGCGCECWIDKGWLASEAPTLQKPCAVHRKEEHATD